MYLDHNESYNTLNAELNFQTRISVMVCKAALENATEVRPRYQTMRKLRKQRMGIQKQPISS